MKGCIRQDDPTSHGGKVTGASSQVLVAGKPVATLGDKVYCPIPGHQDCFIQTINTPGVTVNGIPVAMEGDIVSCGAVLASTTPNSGST